MEFLVTMTTQVPAGTSDDVVADVRRREAAHSHDLAEQGLLLRLWRPPVEPGEWRTLGLFSGENGEQLEKTLASMPLRVWRRDEVTPLVPHPNDPAPERRASRAALPEFFTVFTLRIPQDESPDEVSAVTARDAVRAGELADQGVLVRLWQLPAAAGQLRVLGLWRAADQLRMHAVLDSLPMSSWMTVQTTPLTVHPSDPAATSTS
jgi:muconolactone delta-isomerase